jgi:hypothetical protein
VLQEAKWAGGAGSANRSVLQEALEGQRPDEDGAVVGFSTGALPEPGCTCACTWRGRFFGERVSWDLLWNQDLWTRKGLQVLSNEAVTL